MNLRRLVTGLAFSGGIAAAVVVMTMLWRASRRARLPEQPDFADLLVACAAWTLLGCVAWGGVLLVATVTEVLTRGRWRCLHLVGCPPALRRSLLLALGAAIALEAPLVASASPRPDAPGESAPSGSVAAPGRAVWVARPRNGDDAPADGVTVRPGESLWSIVREGLGESDGAGPTRPAGPRRIARVVAEVHRDNRGLIGPDPDHIEPGQHLLVPWRTGSSRSATGPAQPTVVPPQKEQS